MPLITRYAQRMLIENGISEAIQFFHLDALSSMVGLKVDFDLQITLMASSLYRLMAEKIGREYQRAQAKKIFRNLLDVSARVQIQEQQVTVRLDKRAHNPYLVASGMGDDPTPMLVVLQERIIQVFHGDIEWYFDHHGPWPPHLQAREGAAHCLDNPIRCIDLFNELGHRPIAVRRELKLGNTPSVSLGCPNGSRSIGTPSE